MIKKHSIFMELALHEARKAMELGFVPVGAVLVSNDYVIARAYNHKKLIMHAEMQILSMYERCDDYSLYVTLEPCTMCAGAISLARIKRIVFGAYDPKGGGVIHGVRFFEQRTCHHRPDVIGGVLEEDCSVLLKNFFLDRRLNKSKKQEK